ncbi:hypothetical protein [Maricaulis maris]|uniref:SpoIIAA-like protein n=1 Tax=Maricaulis maris TaxID=74318 RepID=A0A495DEZ6_9PROT|nr:hypothetical protein [Maricaulis maris]RKR00106.1 hypothetical protein C7435_1304 [Maricaulis maris]
MGITYEDIDADGLVRVTLTGLPTRTDHAALIERVGAQIRSGQLRAVIIDASAAELPASTSFSEEVWEDFLSGLGHRPFAYVPPSGHDNAKRQAMIRLLLDEWGTCFTECTDVEQARAWCLARIAEQSD